MKFERVDFEPSSAWQTHVDGWDVLSPLVERRIAELRVADSAGIQRTNRGGWHSPHLDTDGWQDCVAAVVHAFRRILWVLGWRQAASVPIDVQLWANVNPPGAHNELHTHPGHHSTATLYVTGSRSAGALQLVGLKESLGLQWEAEHRVHLDHADASVARGVEIEPLPGRLVIFPAWLPHRVAVNASCDERVSLGFNLSPRSA